MATPIAPIATGITAGQAGRVADRFQTKCRTKGLPYPTDIIQEVIEDQGDKIADEMFEIVRKRVEAKLVLAPRGTHEISLGKDHDPDKFFRTREGLWVYDGFRNLVVAKAKPSKAGEIHKVVRAELMQDLTDKEIETSLGGEHFFEETALCAIIEVLVAAQPNGEEGVLLNNGYANLFYTDSCVVDVDWLSVGRKWVVGTWDRDGYRWDAGRRVFSRN